MSESQNLQRDPYFANLSEHEQWLGKLYEAIESRGVDRSDAQGIVMAQESEADRQWALGTEPEVAAGIILGESPDEPTSDEVTSDRPKG